MVQKQNNKTGKGSHSNGNRPKENDFCSFCGAMRSEVAAMFQGDDGASI